MKGFHQEVVRVVLLDARHRCITKVDIARGTVNESLAAPRKIFRPAIIHSAYAFVLVITTPLATQALLKQIYSSPSASMRLRRFFKSTSWITSSSAEVSVSRKQDCCDYSHK
jgi:RadC-like JAB domain